MKPGSLPQGASGRYTRPIPVSLFFFSFLWLRRLLPLVPIDPRAALCGGRLSQPRRGLGSQFDIDASTAHVHGPLVSRLQICARTPHRLIREWQIRLDTVNLSLFRFLFAEQLLQRERQYMDSLHRVLLDGKWREPHLQSRRVRVFGSLAVVEFGLFRLQLPHVFAGYVKGLVRHVGEMRVYLVCAGVEQRKMII